MTADEAKQALKELKQINKDLSIIRIALAISILAQISALIIRVWGIPK
ncbi:MAG: hypothetical protein ACHQYQ_01295 [Bacteriovoracales bacterium]